MEIQGKTVFPFIWKGGSPMLTAYKNLGFSIADFPNAYHQYENEITLPLYSKLSDEDVAYILQCFKESLEKHQCC